MKYLGQYDISINKARRIVKKYGAQSLEIVKNDIYHLCEVDGFGFITVDTMAQKMNHPMNTLPRVKAAAEYVLKENRTEGHLFIEPEDFLKELKKSLNHKDASYKFADADLRPLANEALETEKITYNSRSIYLSKDYGNEREFAEIMAGRLYNERQADPADIPCPQIAGSGITLSAEQERAVRMALTQNTCIITGGPGTGKTTVLKTFLQLYAKMCKGRDGVLLCAPTGRAARKMYEATGYQAFTIHKAFSLGSEDDATHGSRKHYDLVVIDEFSMADMWISYQVLSAVNHRTKLVFVGDAAQLPSVGPGNVLHELILSGVIPTIQLKQVFRQAQGSSIAENAKRISEANPQLVYDDDFIFVPAENQKEAMDFVCRLYQKAVAALGVEKVQVLTPVRKRGECGANNLNAEIQRMVQGDPEKGRKVFDRYFCEGDPVMQTKNEGGVNNGDLGTVTEASHAVVKVGFYGLDGLREYDDDGLRILDLAYSVTVHKSQGSEYPVVIFPILREHTFMLNRNLFYTAVTRGKSRVVLVGNQWAIREAIRKVETLKRRTHLAARIRANLGEMEGVELCSTEMELRRSA
jgi:exodeoxyribonuclease V alpha subunit